MVRSVAGSTESRLESRGVPEPIDKLSEGTWHVEKWEFDRHPFLD